MTLQETRTSAVGEQPTTQPQHATERPAEVPQRPGQMTVAGVLGLFTDGTAPLRITAFDGSGVGPQDAPVGIHVKSRRALAYLVQAPGELGLTRAYVSGDLNLLGAHPGDPYPLLKAAIAFREVRRPSAAELVEAARVLGRDVLRPVAPPPQELVPGWRRRLHGLTHSKARDAEVIHHHYDVSNAFYERMLGPSMTYTCGVYTTPETTLEDAQDRKYQLIFDKLGLREGDRLLDIGCGWGGMARYAAARGIRVLGVTLAAEQVEWARQATEDAGLSDLVEIRHSDYRDVPETGFDAITSIGMTEHIGVGQYPTYFGFFRDHLTPGGRMMVHTITRARNDVRGRGRALMDRYVFPDGELTGSGRLISEIQNIGLEVVHEECLRPHYAFTLRDWARNLRDHWDEAVAEVGEGTARVWGLMLAGGRIGMERGYLQHHQILAVKPLDGGGTSLPLGQWWTR
ncbi:cyclopropane-fatty-acyl-phospholipid synthase [Rhodococcus sp. SMB37]|nr:cyclopropane-fatty-acyl-phospholipid synthase [Rhodococcus sp. SMB37]